MEGGAKFDLDHLKDNIETVHRIKLTCGQIAQDPQNIDNYSELLQLVNSVSTTIAQICAPSLLSAFFPFIKLTSQDKPMSKFKTQSRQEIVDLFAQILTRIKLDQLVIFFNIYGFLLFELYDPKTRKITNIDEEYKLALVNCIKSLVTCVDSTQLEHLYAKENAPKLSQIIYVLLELAKLERLKSLQIAAIDCLMAFAHVLGDQDFADTVARDQIAQVFLFFLPGIATELKNIALVDEKYGHAVPCAALKAWGRIVALLMEDYNPADRKIKGNASATFLKKPWKDEIELRDYLKTTERTTEWYKENDVKLQKIIGQFFQLARHPHWKIRRELLNLANLLVNSCMDTMQSSMSKLSLIIIALSEDEEGRIARESSELLSRLSKQFAEEQFRSLLENFEEEFFVLVTSLPRVFHGIDDKEQMVALNLLTGFVVLFGSNHLSHVLHSNEHLNNLMLSLIHICEFDISHVSVFEEPTLEDLEETSGALTHRTFRFLNSPRIVNKIEKLCQCLATFDQSQIVYDYLINVLVTDAEHRKEAIFLLNCSFSKNMAESFRTILNTYTEETYWYVPMRVMVDEFGYEHTLGDVRSNIVQICLLVEGIGHVAVVLEDQFQPFLLKTLYLVLERAGCGQSLVRMAGREALVKMAKALSYRNVSELITHNIDYISFHLEKNLRKADKKGNALNVLAVVLRYNKGDHATTIQLFQEMLHAFQRNDENANSYLKVFKMFIISLSSGFSATPQPTSERITKEYHLEKSMENFKVSNIDENVKSGAFPSQKTAEEMYNEDLTKSREQLDNEMYDESASYKKPTPTPFVQLVVEMLRKSLHLLPSKERAKKLLTLDLLTVTVPFLCDWEDELLPMVHQIWHSLVQRFHETQEPLVVIFALKLLTNLARFSHDFIRSRVSKEVLPQLLGVLEKLAKDSRLKDKGSAYRQSQKFKLQLEIVECLATVLTYTDASEGDFDKAMQVIALYLSVKQPIPLQEAAKRFFADIFFYDKQLIASFSSSQGKFEGTECEKGFQELLSTFELK